MYKLSVVFYSNNSHFYLFADTLERKFSGASSPASRELCDNNTCHVQENVDLSHSSDFSESTSQS